MKALSLWQPYASAVALGIKEYETRDWPMPSALIGQVLAVHAAVKDTAEVRKDWYNIKAERTDEIRCRFSRAGYDDWEELPRGMMLGFVRVLACYKTEDALKKGMISPIEKLLGNYGPGRYCTKLRAFYLFDKPIDVIGRQKIFNWVIPSDTVGALTQQVVNSDCAELARLVGNE